MHIYVNYDETSSIVFFQKQNWDILVVCYRDYMLILINDDNDDDGDVIVQTFYFVFFIKMIIIIWSSNYNVLLSIEF